MQADEEILALQKVDISSAISMRYIPATVAESGIAAMKNFAYEMRPRSLWRVREHQALTYSVQRSGDATEHPNGVHQVTCGQRGRWYAPPMFLFGRRARALVRMKKPRS